MRDTKIAAANRAIDLAGGPTKVAKALGVAPPNVCNWRKRGIPADHCQDMEDLVKGAVTCHQMQPRVFRRRSTAA